MNYHITFEIEAGQPYRLQHRGHLRQWIGAVTERHGFRVGTYGYLFCSDRTILKVNRQFLGHDYYTDIITFQEDSDGEEDVPWCLNGDMYISLETVGSNARELHEPFELELRRVIIHGVLHLCGLKDKAPEDAVKMRQAEEEALTLYEEMFPEDAIPPLRF